MLYILYGQDDFSLQEALAEIKDGLGAGELLAANTTVLDGERLALAQLIAICDTAPFLSPQRLVIVAGLLSLWEAKDRRRTPTPEWQLMKDYIPRMPPSTVLVLIEGRLSRANHLLRELKPLARVREFPSLRGTGLRDWIQARVEKGGGSISAPALRVLADLVGNNLWVLASEIDKLCLYTGSHRIEESHVRSLVSYTQEANVFTMVDAILKRRSSAAGELLHQLLAGGAAPPYLLFMITRQFRLLLQAKELLLGKRPPAEIRDRLGLASDYVLTRTLEQARGYSMRRLEGIYRKLLDTDISIKTGRMGGELALDLLVTELCQGNEAA